MEYLIASALAFIVLVFILFGIKRLFRKKLSSGAARRIRKQWAHVANVDDPARKVLEAEKVLDGVFRELGYEGTFGEKLKKIGPLLQNKQAVWDAHKLRNRIAHEVGISISEKEAGRAVKAFEKSIRQFLVG